MTANFDDTEMLLLENLLGREIDRQPPDPSPYRASLEALRRKLEAPLNTDCSY